MPRKHYMPSRSISLRIKARQEHGKKMAKARWDADRARRDAAEPEQIRALAEKEIQNFPNQYGDPTHIVQIQNIATGKVDRWMIRRGDRADRITYEKVDKPKRSACCGVSIFMNHLRGYLCGTKQTGDNPSPR